MHDVAAVEDAVALRRGLVIAPLLDRDGAVEIARLMQADVGVFGAQIDAPMQRVFPEQHEAAQRQTRHRGRDIRAGTRLPPRGGQDETRQADGRDQDHQRVRRPPEETTRKRGL